MIRHPLQQQRRTGHMRLLLLLIVAALLLAFGTVLVRALFSVVATVETTPVPSSGDAADDPAIWIHPTDASLSTVIGTDKKAGIAVYSLDGAELQYRPDGEINNVDLLYNFPLDGQPVTIVTAGNQTSNTIAVYQVNSTTRLLEDKAARPIVAGISIYGSCMYLSPTSGKYYVFVNAKSGAVEQWELFDNGAGLVDATMVRSWDVGSQPEGCVADNELAYFYIGEENVAIWKYGAEPTDGTSSADRAMVDHSGPGGHFTPDVEGLTIYYASNGTGYLIASSQGSSEYVIYERGGSNAYLNTFSIGAGNGIDAVGSTDGIDVTNFPLGPSFPSGLFVTQDGSNSPEHQNYKLVPWQAIANGGAPQLAIDTTWDPRALGSGEVQVGFDQSDYSVGEGAGSVVITVILSAISDETVSVHYATSNAGATAPADYIATSGTLQFPPGLTSQTFSVQIVDDTLSEGPEAVKLELSNAQNAVVASHGSATLTINDDEPPPLKPLVHLGADLYSVSESDGALTFDVVLSAISGQPVKVTVTTSDISTQAGSDYVPLLGTEVTIPAGQIKQSVNLTILADQPGESDELLRVTLSNPTGAIMGAPASANIIIHDSIADLAPAAYLPVLVKSGSGLSSIAPLAHP